MNTLLLFFALPIATIILAIVIEKILRNPILTAATFFAIYLVVAFAFFDVSFLIYAIAYTILGFITAVIAEYFFRRCNEEKRKTCCSCLRTNQINNTATLSAQDIERIANEVVNIQNGNNSNNNECSCNHRNQTDVATVNVTNNTTGGRTSWCCYRR